MNFSFCESFGSYKHKEYSQLTCDKNKNDLWTWTMCIFPVMMTFWQHNSPWLDTSTKNIHSYLVTGHKQKECLQLTIHHGWIQAQRMFTAILWLDATTMNVNSWLVIRTEMIYGHGLCVHFLPWWQSCSIIHRGWAQRMSRPDLW
jgi:hypothetical protein